jgi:hypothetical protein
MESKSKEIKIYPEIYRIYKHYKGGKYKVLSLAKHSETDETVVIYKSLHYGSVHVRPLTMWFDRIQLDKEEVERFTLTKSGLLYEFFAAFIRFMRD